MKKALLFSLFILLIIPAVFAYETVIIKYPPGELWVKVYYKTIGYESILQYVPKGQSSSDFKRTIVVHSYLTSNRTMETFMANELSVMKINNPTGNYNYIKQTDNDSIAFRCTNNYKNVKAQCEFYRATHVHNGIVSLHYINRDKEEFMEHYNKWLEIIRTAKYYNSYYRNERTFNKSEYFELWDD